jgi:hypothetical protein
VDSVIGFTGGGTRRDVDSSPPQKGKSVLTSLLHDCAQVAKVPGASLICGRPAMRGGRFGNAQYQFTMGTICRISRSSLPVCSKSYERFQIADVSSDQQNRGCRLCFSMIVKRRRFGISPRRTTILTRQSGAPYVHLAESGHTCMEVAPEYWQNPRFCAKYAYARHVDKRFQ